MKTVNLDLSKQLKKAGYPQNMDWIYSWYCSEPDCEEKEVQTRDDNYCESCGLVVEGILSPTADEILEQLPKNTLISIDEEGYTLLSGDIKIERSTWKDKILADAAAKMWLYLKKEGLL